MSVRRQAISNHDGKTQNVQMSITVTFFIRVATRTPFALFFFFFKCEKRKKNYYFIQSLQSKMALKMSWKCFYPIQGLYYNQFPFWGEKTFKTINFYHFSFFLIFLFLGEEGGGKQKWGDEMVVFILQVNLREKIIDKEIKMGGGD